MTARSESPHSHEIRDDPRLAEMNARFELWGAGGLDTPLHHCNANGTDTFLKSRVTPGWDER